MELRQLRYFVVVAEELNFQRAGKRLHICPPPLSVQMGKLQKSIGVELLRNRRGRLELTDAGRAFLADARTLLAAAERSVARARQVASGEAGRLIIGSNAVAEYGVFPHIIAAFKQAHPKIELSLRSLRTPQQIVALLEGDLDVGFVCPPIPDEAFDVKELTRQPFVAALPVQHRLAQAPSVSFEALSEAPLITYSRALDPHSFEQIEGHFQRAGASMRVAYEAETSFSMIALTAAGNGCCIVPEYARQFRPDGVVCKPLESGSIERTLAVIKRKDRDGITRAFHQFAADHVGMMQALGKWPTAGGIPASATESLPAA
jgi:DNA-binding transcriptional LysR family regulator